MQEINSYPMYDPCGMKVFDSTEHLIQEIGHSFMVQIHLNDLKLFTWLEMKNFLFIS